jgi:hypothetical protein
MFRHPKVRRFVFRHYLTLFLAFVTLLTGWSLLMMVFFIIVGIISDFIRCQFFFSRCDKVNGVPEVERLLTLRPERFDSTSPIESKKGAASLSPKSFCLRFLPYLFSFLPIWLC